MPRSALQSATVDHCVPLAGIAPLMVSLAAEPVPDEAPRPTKELEMEVRHDQGDLSVDLDHLGKPSYFTCPECHGTLWEIRDGELRYRCRVGHGYSAEGLIGHMDESLENTLWAAARALVETAHLKERVTKRLEEKNPELAQRLRAESTLTRRRADAIKKILTEDKPIS